MKRTMVVIIAIILLVAMGCLLCSCNYIGATTYVDSRIHDVDFVSSAMEDTGFKLTSLNKSNAGFEMCGYSKFYKSQLTGIEYVGAEDTEIDVDYNVVYSNSTNLVNLSAAADEIDYAESIEFSPDMSVEGKYDGTIFINGQEFNIFDIDAEDEESMDDCAVITGIVVGGIALWKILAGVAIVSVAVSMAVYPEFYVKGLEKVAEGMETVGKAIICGMTFILTKATADAIAKIKTNTDSKKYDKYYPTILVNQHNKKDYPRAEIGATLISKYPVKRAQAIKNFKAGIHDYTTYASDARSVISSVWWFDKVYHESAHGIGMFAHYHSNKGYVNGYHMHSFYGSVL